MGEIETNERLEMHERKISAESADIPSSEHLTMTTIGTWHLTHLGSFPDREFDRR